MCSRKKIHSFFCGVCIISWVIIMYIQFLPIQAFTCLEFYAVKLGERCVEQDPYVE